MLPAMLAKPVPVAPAPNVTVCSTEMSLPSVAQDRARRTVPTAAFSLTVAVTPVVPENRLICAATALPVKPPEATLTLLVPE